MKRSNNIKITLLSFVILVAGALLLANVLLLDIKGKNFFSEIDFRQAEGVETAILKNLCSHHKSGAVKSGG